MNIDDDSLECWLNVATFRTVAALGVASVTGLLALDTAVRTGVVPISITGSNSKLAKNSSLSFLSFSLLPSSLVSFSCKSQSSK